MPRLINYSAFFCFGFLFPIMFPKMGAAQSKKPLTPPVATLTQELKRLHLREAVVVPLRETLDTAPRWSPTGNAIAFEIGGKWRTVDLNHVHLVATTWHHGSKVAVIDSKFSYALVTKKQIKSYKPFLEQHPRKAILKNGTAIELINEDMSTTLLVKRKGQKPEQWWVTGLENCYLPIPSPDEKYVAYVAELNGIAIMVIPDK